MTQRGISGPVTVVPLGAGIAEATAAGASVLVVDSVSDFYDTGSLLLNDVQYDYVRPDDEGATLEITPTLETACDEGDDVYALDANGQQQRTVQMYVQLDEGMPPLPFDLLSDVEGHIDEDTPPGTAVVVDLRQGKVLGLDKTPTAYTGQTSQVDPETGEQAGAVNDAGDVTYGDGVFTGTISTAPDRVDLGGYTLADQLDSQPGGRLRGGSRPFDTPVSIGSTYAVLYSMDLMLEDDRSIDFSHETTFDAPAANQPFQIDCYRTWSATEQPAAATTSDELFYSIPCVTAGAADTPEAVDRERKRSLPAGFNRFAFAVKTPSGTVRARGNHRVTLTDMGPAFFEDAFYYDDGAGGGESAGPQPQPPLVVEAVATRWFKGDNVAMSSGPNQYFGRVSTQPSEGNRKSAIWFPTGQIRNALAGATVTKVEVYLNLFSAAGGSSTVVLGSHNSTILNEGWVGINGKNPNITQVENFKQGTARWVTLGAGWNNALWATTYGGVLVGPGPNEQNLYAGGYSGMGSRDALLPRLRISYTR